MQHVLRATGWWFRMGIRWTIGPWMGLFFPLSLVLVAVAAVLFVGLLPLGVLAALPVLAISGLLKLAAVVAPRVARSSRRAVPVTRYNARKRNVLAVMPAERREKVERWFRVSEQAASMGDTATQRHAYARIDALRR